MWTGWESNDLGPAFCGIVAIVQLSNPGLAGGRIIRKVDKSAPDIEIAWFDGVFPLLRGEFKIVSWDK